MLIGDLSRTVGVNWEGLITLSKCYFPGVNRLNTSWAVSDGNEEEVKNLAGFEGLGQTIGAGFDFGDWSRGDL